MLAFCAIEAQVSPLMTFLNVLQFVAIPDWYGVGVVTPLPLVVVDFFNVVVGVGFTPTMLTQTW